MHIDGKQYTREEVLQKIGNVAQLGGARHYTLSDGRSNGVAAVDVDTGSGFRFTVLPDRGLDISLASHKGTNLVYLTPNGEVHPAFYEPQGMGWLRTFFAGLLTTCGLTYLGAPGKDGEEDLGLHGRYSASPAARVCDLSRWDGDDYHIELIGTVEECALFGDKVRLTRTISTTIGSKSLRIRDVAENFGYRTSPFTILYHINPGYPLLDASSKLVLTARETRPCNEHSKSNLHACRTFSYPIAGFEEENFLHVMGSDSDGFAYVAMLNPELHGGLGLYVKFDTATLPYLNEWKMMGQGDYVVGMEPCNAACDNRAVMKKAGSLPFIEPGQSREMNLEIGVAEGEAEISELVKRIDKTGS